MALADPSPGPRGGTTVGASALEVLDRVLGKGIVIDGFMRDGLMSIDLVTVRARVVVTSAETYLDQPDVRADAPKAA
jgi:gas vesicle structural protein